MVCTGHCYIRFLQRCRIHSIRLSSSQGWNTGQTGIGVCGRNCRCSDLRSPRRLRGPPVWRISQEKLQIQTDSTSATCIHALPTGSMVSKLFGNSGLRLAPRPPDTGGAPRSERKPSAISSAFGLSRARMSLHLALRAVAFMLLLALAAAPTARALPRPLPRMVRGQPGTARRR